MKAPATVQPGPQFLGEEVTRLRGDPLGNDHRHDSDRPVSAGQQAPRLIPAAHGKTKYDCVMAVERLTVSIESELALAVREAAEADEQNLSAWLADAARRQLATRGLRDVVAAWEREHGAFNDEELAAARALVDG